MPPAPPLAAPRTTTGFTLDLKPRTAQTPVPRIIYYGVEGFGKTTFACHAPNPVVLAARDERGVQRLVDAGVIPATPVIDINDWPTLLAALDSLATSKHDRKTVVLDSLGAFERLCHEHVVKDSYGGKAGDDGSFVPTRVQGRTQRVGQGTRTAGRVAQSGISIILDTQRSKFKNPTGNDFDSTLADWTHGMALKAWADASGSATHGHEGIRRRQGCKSKTSVALTGW
jgi:hypothetical protein